MTARKPDGHSARVRGTPVRVGNVVPGRVETRESGTPRPLRTAAQVDGVEAGEVARNRPAVVDKAEDSIGARLEQWESLDEQLRVSQNKGRRLFF